MSARSEVLAQLGALHADERLYRLAAAGVSGASELWQDVGMLYLQLGPGGAVPAPHVVTATLQRLRDACTGELAPFRAVVEQALAAVNAGPSD